MRSNIEDILTFYFCIYFFIYIEKMIKLQVLIQDLCIKQLCDLKIVCIID